jgi:hypothetical protein
MDGTSGNLYKQVYLRDNTGTISMKQLTAGGLFLGDSIRVNLNGATLDRASSGLYLQIDSVDVNGVATSRVIKLAIGKNPSPVVTTIAQLNNSISTNACAMAQSIYDGQLVLLNDVEFLAADTVNSSGQPSPYVTTYTTGVGPASTSYILTDCGALNGVQVYTSSYATSFIGHNIPTKSGSVIAIASLYTGATGSASMQLTLRSLAEVNLTQPRCGVDTLTQSFNNTAFAGNSFSGTYFPGWLCVNQEGTNITWTGTQPTIGSAVFPAASAYNSYNPRNVTWLVSPPIQYSATKNLSFQAATAYNDSGYNQLSVLVSTDFNGTNMGGATNPIPNPAHWTNITSSFHNIPTSNGTGNYTFQLANLNPVALSSFLPTGYTGTFYIGFRYIGTSNRFAGGDSTATYAINNVLIRD